MLSIIKKHREPRITGQVHTFPECSREIWSLAIVRPKGGSAFGGGFWKLTNGGSYFLFLAAFFVVFFPVAGLFDADFAAVSFNRDSFLGAPDSNKLNTLSNLLLRDFNC